MVYNFSETKENYFEFITKTNIKYVVKFKLDKKIPNQFERIFYPADKYNTIEMYELTNVGDSISVLSTVSQITKYFLETKSPDLVVMYHIPTTKEEDLMDEDLEYFEKNETKRQKVFRRFLKNTITEDYKIVEENSITKIIKIK
jgi:hypothetical protein